MLKDAASQAFFSLSLGMGAILTYAGYLSREHDLPDESLMIAVSDFGSRSWRDWWSFRCSSLSG